MQQSLIDFFENIVTQHPLNIAIKTQSGKITYQELNNRANQLAHYIQSSHPDKQLFAVLFHQGIELITSILAVLKIGKIYVPLDPNLPQEKQFRIINESNIQILITEESHIDLAHKLKQPTEIISIGNIDLNFSKNNLEQQIHPNQVGYIIHTSGSTGDSKGVFQSNGNILQNALNQISIFNIKDTDIITQFYSPGVMGNVRCLYNALMSGATLNIFNIKQLGVGNLAQWLLQEKITVYHSTASIFRNFAITLSGKEAFPNLKRIILGGEASLKSDFELFQRFFTECKFHSGLGSTETGTICQFNATAKTVVNTSNVPVGFPVNKTEIFLLNEQQNVVEKGQVGEIAVASECLALGYWKKPHLTAQKFINSSNKRIYLTGDLGYVAEDGSLIHAGRKDFQVKISGFRVEPAEISITIKEIPWLQDAVVVAKKIEEELKLVAYFITKKENTTEKPEQEIRHYIKDKLASHQIPSYIVKLSSFPLTPSGKLDREKLPMPVIQKNIITDGSKYEQQLQVIWKDILNTEISRNANFFDQGGHSFDAIRMIAQVRKRMNINIPLQTLFEASTLKEFAQKVEEKDSDHLPIVALNKTEYPLSSVQRQLLFLQQLQPTNSFYNIYTVKKLVGNLDKDCLERAVLKLVSRQTILKTYFNIKNPQNIVQVISQDCEITLDIVHISNEQHIKQEINKTIHKPFSLTKPPLIRFKLICIDPSQYVFCFTVHHIISDHWSLEIIWNELVKLYYSIKKDSSSELPKLELHYGDFCSWQNQQNLTVQRKYWLDTCQDMPNLKIPTDKPRPKQLNFKGDKHLIHLEKNLENKINKLVKNNNSTLFVFMLTAFNILLSRYSNQDDIVVGCPATNRHLGNFQNNIGFFINNIVIRNKILKNMTFTELLSETQKNFTQARIHQSYPFEELVKELNPKRDPNNNPLFQIFINMPELEHNAFLSPFLNIQTLSFGKETTTTRFDLTLYIRKRENLLLEFCYNIDLFEKNTIKNMSNHFLVLLENIVENLEQKIEHISIFNNTINNPAHNNYDKKSVFSKNVYELFDEQVTKTPNKIAIICKEQQITYRDLQKRANQLAHSILKQEIQQEKVIGVYIPRSVEMIVAILAIGKTGAPYIFLDPNQPAQRLHKIIKDTQPQILVTQNNLHCAIKNITKIFIEDTYNNNTDNVSRKVFASSIMFVSYTSGSTGEPKGILHTHYSITTRVAALKKVYPISSQDTVLQITSLAYDPSIRDIFIPLTTGAKIVIASEIRDIEAVTKIIQEKNITAILSIVPSIFDLILNKLNKNKLRLILFQGEVISEFFKQKVLNILPKTIVVNQYGVTENSFAAAHFTLDKDNIYIGKPFNNTRIYILDKNLNFCPIGVSGEIYIAGEGLTRGYANDVCLTAQKFIPDIIKKGERMYKTGDIGLYHSTGFLKLLGRIDQQIKILGTRIEPQEISNAILQHPQIKQCIVISKTLENHTIFLAYLVVNQPIEEKMLTHYVRKNLLEIMVPKKFIYIDQIPLMENGKIDYLALSNINDQSPLHKKSNKSEPRNDLERKICDIWQNILPVEKVGVEDDFFALGGHSLLVISVVNKIRQLLNIDENDYEKLPLAMMLTYPTIREFVDAIENIDTTVNKIIIQMNNKVSNREPLFLLHAAGVDPICYQHLCKYLNGIITAYTISTHELAIDSSIEETARYQINKIKTIQPQGPYFLAGMCMGGLVVYQVAKMLHEQGDEVKFVFIMDSINIPGMKKYKSRQRHKLKKLGRKIKNFYKVAEFAGRVLVLDTKFIKQKIQRINNNINRKVKKISDPRAKLKKTMRNQLRVIRDKYSPQTYDGKIIYIRSEKEAGKYALMRFQELAKSVKCHQVKGTIHRDVSRSYFAQVTSEIIRNYLWTYVKHGGDGKVTIKEINDQNAD